MFDGKITTIQWVIWIEMEGERGEITDGKSFPSRSSSHTWLFV